MEINLIISIVLGIIVVLIGIYELNTWVCNLVNDTMKSSYSAGLRNGFKTCIIETKSEIDMRQVREVNNKLVILPKCSLDIQLLSFTKCDTCEFLEICRG